MKLFYTDHFPLPLPAGHRFPLEKYSRLRTQLGRCDWGADLEFCEAPAASDDQLRLVHTDAYLTKCRLGTFSPLEIRRIGFPWSVELLERSRRSVGGTIAAAEEAVRAGIAMHLAGGTHHASAEMGQGYCVFNDTAVAARVLQQAGEVDRVVIIDLDVHQGNGTAAIFAQDPTVFTFSMHGARNYPFQKHAADLDVELEDGADDLDYLDRLDRALDLVLTRSRAQLALYIAGADPYCQDRLGRLDLSRAGLLARDRMVINRCRHAGLAVAIALGGGYAPDVQEIVDIHTATVFAALESWHSRCGPARSSC